MTIPAEISVRVRAYAPDTDIRLSLHEDLEAIGDEWRAFAAKADCTVFQSFEWLSTWQRHVGSRRGVRPIIVIGRDRATRGILFLLPLSIEPRRFDRWLTWLGSEAGDYNAPILARQFSASSAAADFAAVWSRALGCIQRAPHLGFDLVHFVRMPQHVGAQRNPFVDLELAEHPSRTYKTALAHDWETFYASRRSAATRRRDRRKRKHLCERGEVRFVTPVSAQDVIASMDTLVAMKGRALSAVGVRNPFDRPGYSDFYRSLVSDPATRHIAHVSRLDIDAAPVSVSLGLVFGGIYSLVLSTYDRGEVARLSPGSAHLHELMRHAIDMGCREFDFTVGDEPYKRDWADAELPLYDHVCAARWQAAPVALALTGLVRAKRAIKQTPMLWRAFQWVRARAAGGELR